MSRRLSNSVYVSFISNRTYELDIRNHFDPYGEIESIEIMKSVDGKPAGFAFVNYKRPADAELAISQLEGSLLDGKKLHVEFANPRLKRKMEDKHLEISALRRLQKSEKYEKQTENSQQNEPEQKEYEKESFSVDDPVITNTETKIPPITEESIELPSKSSLKDYSESTSENSESDSTDSESSSSSPEQQLSRSRRHYKQLHHHHHHHHRPHHHRNHNSDSSHKKRHHHKSSSRHRHHHHHRHYESEYSDQSSYTSD